MQAEKSPLTRAVPGYDAENAFLMLFEAAFRKAYTDLSEAGLQLREDKWQPLVVQLAKNCFASGLPQEEVVKRTVFHFYMYKQEVLIREMRRFRQKYQSEQRATASLTDRRIHETPL